MVFKLSSLLDSLPIRVVSRTTQQNLQHCLSNIISCVEFLPLTAKKKFFKKQKKHILTRQVQFRKFQLSITFEQFALKRYYRQV